MDGESNDDWVPSFIPEATTPDDHECVFVQLTPRVLHELYIEMKNLSPDSRQAGTAECRLCGEQVPLD